MYTFCPNCKLLLQVLLNHVVPGALMAADVRAAVESAAPKPAMLSSLLGKTLEVTTDGDDVYVTPLSTDIMAKAIATDVETCVGNVHVIDMVLVPAMADDDVADDDVAVDDAAAVMGAADMSEDTVKQSEVFFSSTVHHFLRNC